MNSRDIEKRVEEIVELIASLHEDLVEEGQNAWITIPAVATNVAVNGIELETSFKLGAIVE